MTAKKIEKHILCKYFRTFKAFCPGFWLSFWIKIELLRGWFFQSVFLFLWMEGLLMQRFSIYTTDNYCHCTANCSVTFPTVVWRYSELLMAVVWLYSKLLMAVSVPAHCHQHLWVPPNYYRVTPQFTVLDTAEIYRMAWGRESSYRTADAFIASALSPGPSLSL